MMAGTTSSNLAAFGTKDINLNSDDESQRRNIGEMPNLNTKSGMQSMITGDPQVEIQPQLNQLTQKIVNNMGEIKEITGAFFSSNMLSNENCNKFSNGLIWSEDLINNNEKNNSRTANNSRTGNLQKRDIKQSETPLAKNYNIDLNERQMMINDQSNSNIFTTLKETNINNNTPKPAIKTKQSLSNSQNFSHVTNSNHHYYMAAAQKLRNFGDDDPTSVAAILPMIQKN